MAIVFQLGSGPQVRRSASRASSPSRTRSQTRPAYAAPNPADHGADVTGGERELSHQSHTHRWPQRPRERVAKGAGGEGPHTGGGAGRGWRRAAHGWWSGARVAKGRTRVVERGAGGEGPHTGGGAVRGRWSGRLATVRIASGLADRSQTVSRITDSTAGTSRTSSPSRTRSATRPAARTSEAAAWTRASSAVGTATSARTIPVRIETLASDFTLRSAARARPAAARVPGSASSAAARRGAASGQGARCTEASRHQDQTSSGANGRTGARRRRIVSRASTRAARAALVLALDTILRLLAPVLPFATEEVWSWWRAASVHRAPWPDAAPLRAAADDADPGTLAAAGRALAALRKVKSEAKVSMRTGIVRAEVAVPTAELALVQAAASDVRAAGRVADLVLLGDDVRDVPAVLSVILETV